MNVTEMVMLVVVDNHSFQKDISPESRGIFSDEYGVYLPNTEHVDTFQELITLSHAWLQEQD